MPNVGLLVTMVLKKIMETIFDFSESDDYYLENRLDLLHQKITALNQPSPFFFTDVCFDNIGDIEQSTIEKSNEFKTKYDFFML